MAIHNESLIRVVHVARGVGALLVAGGALILALAVISAIRHPSLPWPWSSFFSGLLGEILGGVTLLISASRLDQGRAWAFYSITGVAGTGIIWSGAAVLLSPNPRPGVVLMMMLALATVCGIAWPQVHILRKRKPYAPLAPIPSTAVVIPPPPARLHDQQLQP